MAITITQQPTTPGMANSDLLFAVTSTTSSSPQYQFVCDILYSGSSSVLQRIKQQPNPSATGVFDVGQIIHNYLESDNTWKTAEFATATEVSKRFSVKFGEEYGTSVSSSVTLYNGNNVVGTPAKSGSNYYYIINGLVNPYDAVNWNFPSASYYQDVITPTGGGDTLQEEYALTNAPITKSVQVTEYETISLINGNFANEDTRAQDVYGIQVLQYNSAGTQISSSIVYNTTANGGGPRANANEEWGDAGVYNAQTSATQLLTMGVGPANLLDAGIPISSSCAYYTVKAFLQESAGTADLTNWFSFRRYNIEGPACGYDGVRFAWKNEFGVWDYYTFTLQSDSAFTIERQAYEQTFVNYSTTSTTVAYNKERRGAKQFYNALTQVETANSNWLSQAEADWLKELFFSTNVFQQIGTEFFPIVIDSATLVEKTNPRTQTTFQYVIEFKPANQLRPRE
jgi:hypothetical protein